MCHTSSDIYQKFYVKNEVGIYIIYIIRKK